MKTPIRLAGALAGALLAAPAFAQRPAPLTGTAFELTPYAGYLVFGNFLQGPLGTSVRNAPAALYGAQLGMKLTPNVSLVGNLGYSSTDVQIGIPFLGGYNVARSSTLLYDGGVQLDLPMTTASGYRFVPFAQLGAGAMRYDISQSIVQTQATNFAANVGAGADLAFGPSFGLRVMAKDYFGKFDFNDATQLDLKGQTAHNWAFSAGLRVSF